jgi:hypothetical protein
MPVGIALGIRVGCRDIRAHSSIGGCAVTHHTGSGFDGSILQSSEGSIQGQVWVTQEHGVEG